MPKKVLSVKISIIKVRSLWWLEWLLVFRVVSQRKWPCYRQLSTYPHLDIRVIYVSVAAVSWPYFTPQRALSPVPLCRRVGIPSYMPFSWNTLYFWLQPIPRTSENVLCRPRWPNLQPSRVSYIRQQPCKALLFPWDAKILSIDVPSYRMAFQASRGSSAFWFSTLFPRRTAHAVHESLCTVKMQSLF